MNEMVIVNIEGGFGNQLFSYAFGYAQSRRLNLPLWIDTSLQDNGLSRELEIDKLKITFDRRISYPIKRDILSRAFSNRIVKKLNIGLQTKVLHELIPYTFDQSMLEISKKNVYYAGNWQNYRYFDDYREDLKNLFQPQKALSSSFYDWKKSVAHENTVSIHIRRGDYVQIGCTVDEEYYHCAIERVQKKVPDAQFFVFTDDKEYASNLMDKTKASFEIVDYVKQNSTLEDFYLMCSCSHHIVANSSYSWWAAYLGNRDVCVIAPVTGIWKEDFYPDDWERISIE